MKYLNTSFSVFVGTDTFNEGWDRIFKKKMKRRKKKKKGY